MEFGLYLTLFRALGWNLEIVSEKDKRRQNKQTNKKMQKKGLTYDQFTSQPTAVTNNNLMFACSRNTKRILNHYQNMHSKRL